MSSTALPRSSEVDVLRAVIEEARKRTRMRRRWYGACALVAGGAAASAFFGFGGKEGQKGATGGGPGERPTEMRRAPSSGRLQWAVELGRSTGSATSVVRDPVLVRKIEQAARSSGARAVDVTVLALSEGGHVPVVTLESAAPAAYMKHRLGGFLEGIGLFDRDALGFVELFDARGRYAWSGGYWRNGGMVGSRPELDQCSPIAHSQPVTYAARPSPLNQFPPAVLAHPAPCPAG